MAEKAGLFRWIRETSFLKFIIAWIASIFIFTIIYWLISTLNSGINIMSVDSSSILFNLNGLIDSLYASLLIATIFGIIKVVATGVFRIFVHLQLAFSIIVVLILIDKLLQKYVFPHYHIHHTQDKKINTVILTMSIFRSDIDRLKAEFKAKTKHDVNMKEIEAMIDGLYVTFLDIEKMFSARNMHRKNITDHQHMMVIANIEDSLHKFSKFIDFLEEHKIAWKDKSVEFWLRYILETADKITMHFDDIKIKNPKLVIAIENIKDWTQSIEKKL
ncbi:MAG: hypothetical protein ACP5OA_01570 [Candidatus Woesearchaeota archaeon]